MSSISHATRIQHPEWCKAALCERTGTEVFHRAVIGRLDLGYADSTVSVARVQCDELIGDQQVAYPSELEIQCGQGEPIMMTDAKFREFESIAAAGLAAA